MSTTNGIPVLGPETPALSEPQRIVDTFIAPTKTFTDLKRNSSWWVPWVITAVFSYIFVAVVANKVGFDQVAENQIKMSPKRAAQIEKLSAEQRARQMDMQLKITKGIAYTFPFVNLISLIVVAALLMATFKFGASAEVPFKTSLAIVMYASLPLLVKTTLAIVSLLAGANPEGFTFQNPVGTNIGYYIDPATSAFLHSFGSGLDAIMMWTLALTAIGFTCVSKVKRGASFAIVYGWYFLVILVGSGLAAAFA